MNIASVTNNIFNELEHRNKLVLILEKSDYPQEIKKK